MASIDQSAVATALPALQTEFGVGLNWSSWTVTTYALVLIVVMPVAGRVSDVYGRRAVFIGSIVVFTVASVCCGLADDIHLLILLRAAQAVGGGAFMPSATGIVADLYGDSRDRAIGLFGSVFPIGGVLGPVVGGFLVDYSSWRAIFFVNVPIGVVLLLLAVKVVPDSTPSKSRGIDILGVVLLGFGLISGMYGVTMVASDSAARLLLFTVFTVLIAPVAIALFLRRSLRVPTPAIPPLLLRGRHFAEANLLNLLWGAANMGFSALVPLYAVTRYDMDALAAGSLLASRAVGMSLTAAATSLSLRRFGYRRPMLLGFAVTGSGLMLLSVDQQAIDPYRLLLLASAIVGVGMGIAIPASNVALLDLASDQAAAVTGVRGMFRQSGGIVGVSIAGAVVTASGDPAQAQAFAFAVLGLLLLTATPLILRIPDRVRYRPPASLGGARRYPEARSGAEPRSSD
jgi:EmrB/QacA subfamily drug resistance transporter